MMSYCTARQKKTTVCSAYFIASPTQTNLRKTDTLGNREVREGFATRLQEMFVISEWKPTHQGWKCPPDQMERGRISHGLWTGMSDCPRRFQFTWVICFSTRKWSIYWKKFESFFEKNKRWKKRDLSELLRCLIGNCLCVDFLALNKVLKSGKVCCLEALRLAVLLSFQ